MTREVRRAILATPRDPLLTLARWVLALVMFPHGAQKLLGWFGGPGFGPTLVYFDSLGLPGILTALVVIAEFGGALALLVGLFSRVAALGIALTLTGAALIVHLPNGFFMNWSGTSPGEGFEYHVLAVALATLVAVRGGGAFSVDRALR
ncbi:DoxX family protein [Amycolatopsis magusensis]|uniref:DoxX family protein n=1 Tax=Amycolatopsis magusensis TaxID=882444 RepID=UPI00379CE037